jgi:hypothetical protein
LHHNLKIKPRRMKFVGHVGDMEERMRAFGIFGGKSEGRGH